MTFEWPIERGGLPALPEPTAPEYATKLAERNGAESLAITVLWALSGRQFGLKTVTARPCPLVRRPWRDDDLDSGVTSYVLSWEGDHWLNIPCWLQSCRSVGPNMALLPGPVAEVTLVEVNGVALPPNVWAIEGNVLYRREGPWPGQDFNRPLGDPGTWGVTYKRGLPVPEGVDVLTGLLAKEFITALNNNGQCRLPRTVTTASRQGVTYRAYDPAVIYANGKTGLPEVDMWLASVNPHALMAAPSVR